MFGIGGFELFLILVFGFLIFGPDKLPQIANTIGKAIAKFRTAQEDMKGQLNMDSFMDKDAENPFKNPLEVIESATDQAKASASTARAKADAATDKVVEHTESFAERKARYDRERRARKEAEAAEAAKRAEQSASAPVSEPRGAVVAKKAVSASDGAVTSRDAVAADGSGKASEKTAEAAVQPEGTAETRGPSSAKGVS